ncbi:hypothetical protein AN958_11244 [Leucoagaricus sp. SymC.cos]|nr:hypothetical protein AN958_11244 [Leucoagaricus sp. SymC.cos]
MTQLVGALALELEPRSTSLHSNLQTTHHSPAAMTTISLCVTTSSASSFTGILSVKTWPFIASSNGTVLYCQSAKSGLSTVTEGENRTLRTGNSSRFSHYNCI